MKSVLVTGVAGFIGSNLAKWILDNTEYTVIGIDNLSGGYEDNVPDGVTCYKSDLDTDDIEYIFEKHSIEYVFHLAAYAAEGLSPFLRKFNYRNNLVATANIVNACINHDVKRLVYTSSMAVYGHGKAPFDEADLPSPIDCYGIAKYSAEQDIAVACEQHGLDYCIIRPHNFYGPGQNIWDRYRNVLGIWMYYLLHDKDICVFGDGEQQRAFSFIDDSLKCFWNAAVRKEASEEIINLGGIHPYTIREAAETLADIAGTGDIVHLEPRHEVKEAYSTYQKSVDLLGFEHKTNLREGLEKMWEWAKAQPNRDRVDYKDYEITKGIYEFWKKD